MTSETSSEFNSPRSWRWLFGLLMLAVAPSALALTALPFVPARALVTNELTRLSALPAPARSDLIRSNVFARADAVFVNGSLNDGQALRKLRIILSRYPECTPALDAVATNLVTAFIFQYNFVGSLLVQLPPSEEATIVTAKYNALAPAVAKLTAVVNAAKVSALHDPIKRRLDKIFSRLNEALLVPFPENLTPNTVAAFINGKYFRTSATASSENTFQAVATETNVSVTLSALDYQSGALQRGILFSVPNVQSGTFRYGVPDAVSFTNRTDVDLFTGASNDVGATNGAVFIGTTATEAFGIFECSGPGFTVLRGGFRITLSRQP